MSSVSSAWFFETLFKSIALHGRLQGRQLERQRANDVGRQWPELPTLALPDKRQMRCGWGMENRQPGST